MTDENRTAARGASPGRPARDTVKQDCQHWLGDEQRHCRSGDNVHRYVIGHRCGSHSPAALAGRPEPTPGPGWPIFREVQP